MSSSWTSPGCRVDGVQGARGEPLPGRQYHLQPRAQTRVREADDDDVGASRGRGEDLGHALVDRRQLLLVGLDWLPALREASVPLVTQGAHVDEIRGAAG